MTTRKNALAATALLLLAGLALLALGRRGGRRVAGEPARVVLTFRVPSQQMASAVFLKDLDVYISQLRATGVRIGRILPDPRRARVSGEGLDEEKARRALGELPLALGALGRQGLLPEVEVRFPDEEAAREEERAMLKAARDLRARVEAARPCERCAPLVERVGSGELRLTLPWIDDLTERRLLDALASSTPPAERLALVERRVVPAAPGVSAP